MITIIQALIYLIAFLYVVGLIVAAYHLYTSEEISFTDALLESLDWPVLAYKRLKEK